MALLVESGVRDLRVRDRWVGIDGRQMTRLLQRCHLLVGVRGTPVLRVYNWTTTADAHVSYNISN